MAIFLDRIDSVPVINSDIDMQLMQWLAVLVDALNEDIADIEGGLMSTTDITGTTQDVEVNSTYISSGAALTLFQLPDQMAVGDRVTIAGFGAGGWKLLLSVSVSQTIQIAEIPQAATVSVASSSRYDSIEMICVEANKTWITLSTSTTGFVVV